MNFSRNKYLSKLIGVQTVFVGRAESGGICILDSLTRLQL